MIDCGEGSQLAMQRQRLKFSRLNHIFLVGWVIKPKTLIEEIELSGKFRAKTLFTIVIKYIAPVCILAVLCFAIAEGMGWLKV
jgi:SNF family Na+-dependent transporter